MVDFTSKITATGVPNMTGASRGTGPDQSFAALFEGLTNTVKNVAVMKDQQTQEDIRDDAEQIFESVNNDFGLSAPDVPAGMQGELDRVQSLQTALKQGKISEVNYYGRLATLSKQLRAKYPKYEEIVDATIQNVTGTRPANAYRNAIFSQLNQLATEASDEEKFRRNYEKQFQGEIVAAIGPDYFDHPENYDFNQVQKEVAKFRGKSLQIQAEQQELALLAKQGEVNDKRAMKNASQAFSFVVQSGLNAGLGTGSKNFNQVMDEFATSGGQNLEEVIQAASLAERQIRTALEAKAQKDYVGTGIMTQDQANDAIDAAMYPIMKAKEAILGGDFKYAARWATLNKDIQDQGVNDILNSSPEARAGYGLDAISKTLGDQFFLQNQGAVSSVALEAAGQAITGRNTKVLNEMYSNASDNVKRQTFKTMNAALASPNLKGEELSSAVDSVFGKNAYDMMSTENVEASDIQSVYSKMLSPDIINNIVKNGTSEDLAKVTDWALEKFGAIPAFRKAAGDVNSYMNLLDEAKIHFDPKSNRLVVDVAEGSTFDPLDPTGPLNKNVLKFRQFLGQFNQAMASLAPVLDANGMNKEEIVDQLMKSLSIEYETRGQPGFWSKLGQKVSEGLSSAGENVSETPRASDMINLPEIKVLADDVVDWVAKRFQRNEDGSYGGEEGLGEPSSPFDLTRETGNRPSREFLDMIGTAEGAGYNTIFGNTERKYGADLTNMSISDIYDLQTKMTKDMGSSAVGKYQVLKGTLRDAVKALKIPLDTKFTPEVQDAIAHYLLERRGFSDWQSGDLSSSEFLNSLSKEWASIPTTGGASFYAGDRMGNKASRGGQAIAQLLLKKP